MTSPVGLLVVQASPIGLVRISFGTETSMDDLGASQPAVRDVALGACEILDQAKHELAEYFTRARQHFTVPIEFGPTTRFQLAVLNYLCTIAYGTKVSYATIAKAIGNPLAIRAVGNVCASNRLPIIVPCHRVIRSNGTTAGYAGGLNAKAVLVLIEEGP